ncbi:uncharacterized protein CPUR_05332 [Claviceps purpurea 20.1]|uniref:Uncharacterized protein n=1 Tax=Claviceps purpurea (strain 20.1) TaxID=1111077 RepID=M1W817_CLAP2|nr:uncharacterized protein CPUR_05332 [Claviceps purpurea 20.1]
MGLGLRWMIVHDPPTAAACAAARSARSFLEALPRFFFSRMYSQLNPNSAKAKSVRGAQLVPREKDRSLESHVPMFLPPSPTILNVIAVSGDWCDRESRSSGHETGPYDVAEDGGDAFHSAGSIGRSSTASYLEQ